MSIIERYMKKCENTDKRNPSPVELSGVPAEDETGDNREWEDSGSRDSSAVETAEGLPEADSPVIELTKVLPRVIIGGKEKSEDSWSRGLPAIEPVKASPRSGIGGKDKTGWVSPKYTMSRSVELVPDVMSSNRCVGFFHDAPEVEYYRLLRTQILHRVREKGGNTLMVTSSAPGEGKTLTAINLAFTFAREFKQTVLLVDCDLRMQKIHEYLGFTNDKGLIDYLLDDAPVSDLITWPGIEKLTIISGGRTTVTSSELLGSPRMKELVDDMKTRYPDRLIIFDLPPVLAAADALAFAPLTDHILFVVRAGHTSLQDIRKSLSLLPKEKIAGLVMNRQKFDAKSYSYHGKKNERRQGLFRPLNRRQNRRVS